MNLIEALSDALLLEKGALISFSATAPHRYKVYSIPKRSSGRRVIAHPSGELKYIQRALVDFLDPLLSVEDCAFAYRAGFGIKENAEKHLSSRYLLKMDFENFFNSIKPDLLFGVMEERGVSFSREEKNFLSGVLFWKPKRGGGLVLSVGAPSSPLISNFVMSSFDEAVMKSCKDLGVTYTRYADDLTFSTNMKGVLFGVPRMIECALIETVGSAIKINARKTVFSSKAHNRHVTGVTLSNDNKLSLGRHKKRQISAMIHHYSLGRLDDGEAKKLQGLLSHAGHIDPDFYYRMKKKYGANVIDSLKKALQAGPAE